MAVSFLRVIGLDKTLNAAILGRIAEALGEVVSLIEINSMNRAIDAGVSFVPTPCFPDQCQTKS